MAYVSTLRVSMRGNISMSSAIPAGATMLSLSGRISEVEGSVATLLSSTANIQSVTEALRTDLASRPKDIRVFTAEAAIDTTQRDSTATLTFPEPVDIVAIESITNDGHDMWKGQADRINANTFSVRYISARGEGVRWIPGLRFIGVRIVR